MKSVTPTAQLGVALAQQRSDQAAKGLRPGRIRDVTLVLIEFAGRKQRAGRHEHFMQFVYDGRFADAGMAEYQHELRCSAFDNAIKRGKQRTDLALASVEFLGNYQPLGRVASAQRKRFDGAPFFELGQAAPEIAFEPGGRLIALLSRLRCWREALESSGIAR